MFFSSIEEINMLLKEINRLLSKGRSNMYLKVTIEKKVTYSKLRCSKFKKFVFRVVFGELQLTQVSLNFQTSCYNLKTRGRSKTVYGFSVILILKGIMRF